MTDGTVENTGHESCYEKSRQGLCKSVDVMSTEGNEQSNIAKTYSYWQANHTGVAISHLYSEDMDGKSNIYIVTAILNRRSMLMADIYNDDQD